MAKKKENAQKQNISTDTKLSVFVEDPGIYHREEFFEYGSKEIHNPDFYKAYQELLTPEKRYPTFTTFKDRLEAEKKKGIIEYSPSFKSQLDSYRSPLKKRIAYHTNWAIKVDTRKTDIQKTCKEHIEDAFIILFFAFIGFVVLAYIADLLFNMSKHDPSSAKWFFIIIVEAVIIFFSIKLYNRFKPIRNAKKLTKINPYYMMADDLLYIESRKVQFEFPTKRIDSNYRKYKNNIELEWKVSSHNFITDTFFRFKAFDCRFSNYGDFRFFVELKYEPCFPDYPELLSIEKQVSELKFIDKVDDKPKARITLYKTKIRDTINELIKERIPKMVVTNIIIAVGVLSHNPKSRKDNDFPVELWRNASWRKMIRKDENNIDDNIEDDISDNKDNKIIPAKNIENTEPPVL